MERIVGGFVPYGKRIGITGCGFAVLTNRVEVPTAETAAGRRSVDEVSEHGALWVVAELDGHSWSALSGMHCISRAGEKNVARRGDGATCFFLGNRNRFFFCGKAGGQVFWKLRRLVFELFRAVPYGTRRQVAAYQTLTCRASL
jgi:hypothetical protein